MANQDPQPEVYTTVHDFSVATASGTQSAVSIFTNQANNEEVRVYAVAVDFALIDAAGNQITSTTDPKFTMPTDFTMALSVGPNNIPSNAFDCTGTPSTGKWVCDAIIPGRWAAPPAPAIITSKPCSAAVFAKSASLSGVR